MGFTDDELIKLIPRLKRYAYTFGNNADDLVQSTLERAIVKRHLYTPGQLQQWLFTIMRNIRLSEIKHRKHHKDGYEVDENTIDPTQQTEINVYIHEIEKAISNLPSGQRDVLNYITFHGGAKPDNPYQKCATALGINIGTVRSRLNRARESLRNRM